LSYRCEERWYARSEAIQEKRRTEKETGVEASMGESKKDELQVRAGGAIKRPEKKIETGKKAGSREPSRGLRA